MQRSRDREDWGNVERDKQAQKRWETERGKKMENRGEIIDADREIKMGQGEGCTRKLGETKWREKEKRRDIGRGREWRTKNRSFSLPV